MYGKEMRFYPHAGHAFRPIRVYFESGSLLVGAHSRTGILGSCPWFLIVLMLPLTCF